MEIRRATVGDIEAMIELGRQFHAECTVPFPLLDDGMVRDLTPRLLDLPNEFLAFLAVDPRIGVRGRHEDVFGMLIAEAAHYVFSPETVVQHDILYVRPDRRGSSAAVRLIRGFEDWARAIGATHATLSVHSGISPRRTGRLYEKLGYSYQGGHYCSEVM